MDELLAVINEQGWLFAIGLYLLFNLSRIGAGLERIAGRFFPTWAEERKIKLEMQRDVMKREQEARDEERTDTIIVLKEMLIATKESLAEAKSDYKSSLADANIERQRCHAELVRVVASYEKNNAAWLEAFRDVSSVLREQGRSLEKIMAEVRDGK